MKRLSGLILKVFGWRLTGVFPEVDKSVIIFAPHTSNWDFIIGKLYLNSRGVKANALVKKELFFFPMNLIMIFLGSIPVDRKNKKNNVVSKLASVYDKKEKFNLIVSAEGTRAKVSNWKRGFYNIAKSAEVPIVVSYIDFEKKEVGIKGVVEDTSNIEKTMKEITAVYKNVKGKYPENFATDKSTINFYDKN